MTARPHISRRLRFAVLHRDNFTCRYCGLAPPTVVLHLDHVIPVCDGGETNAGNLVTSCDGCNIGKGVKHIDRTSDVNAGATIKAIRGPRNADERTLRMCLTEQQDAIVASIALSGLTYREIAARIGVSKSIVNAWGKGERSLTDRRTTAFCNATGTNLVRQFRDLERALREAAGRTKARDRIAAIVAPTEKLWSAVA